MALCAENRNAILHICGPSRAHGVAWSGVKRSEHSFASHRIASHPRDLFVRVRMGTLSAVVSAVVVRVLRCGAVWWCGVDASVSVQQTNLNPPEEINDV